jgi:hypothetical protein
MRVGTEREAAARRLLADYMSLRRLRGNRHDVSHALAVAASCESWQRGCFDRWHSGPDSSCNSIDSRRRVMRLELLASGAFAAPTPG